MIAYFEIEERPAQGLIQRLKWRLDPLSRLEI